MKKLFMLFFFVVLAFCAKYDISVTITVSKEREQSRAEMFEAVKTFAISHNPIVWMSNYLAFNDCSEWDSQEACKTAKEAGYDVQVR